MAPRAKASTTTSVNKWDAELAALAGQTTASVSSMLGGGNMINISSGRLTYKGAEVPDNELDVVVVDHILANLFYEGRYNAANPQPPSCYAFSRNEKEEPLVPHADSDSPQCGDCKNCPNNQWGTAETGRGKACQNTVRLAVITADSLDNPADAEVAFMKVSVTSVKNWAAYADKIAKTLNRPPFCVVTQLRVVPDGDTQHKIEFRMVEQITDSDTIGALLALHKDVKDRIAFPFQKPVDDPQPQKGRGRGQGRAAAAPAKAPAKPGKFATPSPAKGRR